MNRPQKQATVSRPSILRRFCKDGQAVACIFPSPQTHLPPRCAGSRKTAPQAPPSVNVATKQPSEVTTPSSPPCFSAPPVPKRPLRAKRGTGGSQAPDIQRIANNPLRKKRRGLYVNGSVSAACLPPPHCPHAGQPPLGPQARPATTGRGGGPLPGAHRSRPCCSRCSYLRRLAQPGSAATARHCGGLLETALLAAAITNCFLHHYLFCIINVDRKSLHEKKTAGQAVFFAERPRFRCACAISMRSRGAA